MASFVKFNCFSEDVVKKVHNLGSDSLRLALSNTAPAASDTVFAPGGAHPPPAAANGYTTGGHVTAQVSCAQTSGTLKLVLTDVTVTATAGGIGPFRYVILYNDTASADQLIGYWDRGTSITLADTESVLLDTDAANGVLQIA